MRAPLLAALLAISLPALAQETAGRAPSAGELQALDSPSFVALAASLAMLEIEAGGHALQAAARPEVLDLARDTVQLQGEVMERLRAAAQARGLVLPEAMSLEHQAVVEGLTPLDGEELARRYAEAQVQALGQAVTLYRAGAGQDRDPELKSFAAAFLPRLEQQAQVAQGVLEAVRR
jgi:putative membrane protein